jgi:hypothetical protein
MQISFPGIFRRMTTFEFKMGNLYFKDLRGEKTALFDQKVKKSAFHTI